MLNFLSMGTIMFAMFILGSFILLGVNLERITINWRDQIQFNVFLADAMEDGQLEAIGAVIEASDVVTQSVYISKEDARTRFGAEFGDYTAVVEGLEINPFPASYQVSLMRGTQRASFDALHKQLMATPGVDEIYYDEEIFQRLDFFIRLIRIAGLFFGSVMVFSSIFTISNVLKLTFFTRREEVDIMKLVGASRAYIRAPFIVEGMQIGFLGSLLGVILVFGGYLFLGRYVEQGNLMMAQLDLVFIPMDWILILLTAGIFSGLLGSLISLHQFLEEHISYQ